MDIPVILPGILDNSHNTVDTFFHQLFQSLYQVIQRTILPNLQHYNGGLKKTIMGHVPYQEGEGEYL